MENYTTNSTKPQQRGNKCPLMAFLIMIGMLASCGTAKHIQNDTVEKIVYKDSVVVERKDSVVYIPVEKIVDIVPEYDTLYLETSLASSKAYVDTLTHSLKGMLENKDGVLVESHIEYRDRIIERTDTLTQTKVVEIPKVVKVPKYNMFFYIILIYSITLSIYLIVKLYLKLKNKGILESIKKLLKVIK